MILQQRRQRMREVASRRLARVSCACESLHHRHNVSAVLRSCDAMGIGQVHLVERTFIPGKGASRGAERWLEIQQHPDPATALRQLRDTGWRIWIADFSGEPVPPEQVPLDEPVCLWFGSEFYGVSDQARAAADGVVTVPMYGFTQSLNVSVAAGLLLRAVAERAHRRPDAHLDEASQRALVARWEARESPYLEALDARP